ncbi:MAG: VirB3 family type IV secretion system protein [Rickettsiaceae bacterium]|nr:VirB3 family type IV secretion system protein [Rickettsiaceae bacterium]
MSYRIVADPLFIGLTRPNLILGVSFKFAILNILISVNAFIQTSNFKIILLALLTHGIGYYLCFKEPRFVELYLTKYTKCNLCSNKIYYGGNSYFV